MTPITHSRQEMIFARRGVINFLKKNTLQECKEKDTQDLQIWKRYTDLLKNCSVV